MTPRPHNSFHGSIEAADISRFEQHIQSICNLPLGKVKFHTPFRVTNNVLGGSWEGLLELMKKSSGKNIHFHICGKGELSPDRKMGHYNKLFK